MNSIFKKFGSVVLMLAMAANVNAQEMVAKIAPVSIAPGEEAEIAVAYENTTEFSYINMQVDFTLPEGLSFVETESVDEDDEPIMVYGVKGDAALTSHNLVYNMLGEEGKTMRFSLQNMKMKNLNPLPVKPNSGIQISFRGIWLMTAALALMLLLKKNRR